MKSSLEFKDFYGANMHSHVVIIKMPQARCSFFLANKNETCSFRGKHEFENEWYCKTHYNFLKSRDECSICFNQMTDTKNRIRLSCGHFFHKTCLSHCHKAECPLCRKAFEPEESVHIFSQTVIKPLMVDLFALPMSTQVFAINSMRSINSLAHISEWHASTMYQLVTIFSKHTNNPQLLYNAMISFLNVLQVANIPLS